MIASVGKAGGAIWSESAGNCTIIYITADMTCANNYPPLPKEQDPQWLRDQLNALRKKTEEDWKRYEALLEEWRRVGERLEQARYDCEVFRIPAKKQGHGRKPKKWDTRRPQKTTRVRQKRPRRR